MSAFRNSSYAWVGGTDSLRTCPRCSASVVRVRRRLVDRLMSLLTPRHRYRCCAAGCGWKGLLPAASGRPGVEPDGQRRYRL